MGIYELYRQINILVNKQEYTQDDVRLVKQLIDENTKLMQEKEKNLESSIQYSEEMASEINAITAKKKEIEKNNIYRQIFTFIYCLLSFQTLIGFIALPVFSIPSFISIFQTLIGFIALPVFLMPSFISIFKDKIEIQKLEELLIEKEKEYEVTVFNELIAYDCCVITSNFEEVLGYLQEKINNGLTQDESDELNVSMDYIVSKMYCMQATAKEGPQPYTPMLRLVTKKNKPSN